MDASYFVNSKGFDMVQPTLSVVVISYNRPAYLEQSLSAVYAQVPEETTEVIVVDNRSASSPEVAKVVAKFPQVRFLPQAKNLGFAAGANIGMAAARGDYIHLHEDDIILHPGFYSSILPIAAENPDALLSGIIYEQPGSTLLFAGIDLSIGVRFTQESYPAILDNKPYPTGMLLGAMMVGHRQVFRRIGFFRPEFFVYFEDAEYCWRARLQGIRLIVVPSARGIHLRPINRQQSPIIEYHKLKNYLAVNVLYMKPWPLAWLIIKYFLYTSTRKAWQMRSLSFLLRSWARAACDIPRYLAERLRTRPDNSLSSEST